MLRAIIVALVVSAALSLAGTGILVLQSLSDLEFPNLATGVLLCARWAAAAVLGAAVWLRGEGRERSLWLHGVAVCGPAVTAGLAVASVVCLGVEDNAPDAVGLVLTGLAVGTAMCWMTAGLAFPAVIAPAAALCSALTLPKAGPAPWWRIGLAGFAAALGTLLTALLGAMLVNA